MAFQLPPNPKFQQFDANGNPLTGGKLYTYLAGSSNPVNTYTDSSGSTANTNPIILDARGEADLWISDTVLYKFVLTDASDVEIWSVDNISATAGGSGGGGGNDEFVRVTGSDLASQYLSDKLAAGPGIVLNVLNSGGVEQLQVELSQLFGVDITNDSIVTGANVKEALDDLQTQVSNIGTPSLGSLTDVTITNPSEGQSLVYDGTDWTNQVPIVYVEVQNGETTAITRGQPVYVSGSTGGGTPKVKLADNDGTNTYPAIGLVADNTINAGADGRVLISGILDNIDTSTYSVGSAVYLDSTAGDLTSTRPTSDTEKVQKVGLITRQAVSGSILVIGAGRTNDVPNELTALTGVSLNAIDLGTFTGSIIPANRDIKEAFQDVSDAISNNVIPNPAIDGAFIIKDVNGTYTMLDGVSAPPFYWDSTNSKYEWLGQVDYSGSFNFKLGSIINFLDGAGTQEAFISSGAGSMIINSDALGTTNNKLDLLSGGDVDIVAGVGYSVNVNNNLIVTGEASVYNLPVGTQVGLVGYDATGKLIQGTSNNTPGGANTEVQFNDNGVLAGDSQLTFDKANGDLTIDHNMIVGNRLLGGVGAETTGGVLDFNDPSNRRSGSGKTLLNHQVANAPQQSAVGSNDYWHTFNFEFSSKTGSGNLTQLAIPYGSTSGMGSINYRSRFNYLGQIIYTGWRELIASHESTTERVFLFAGSTNNNPRNGDFWFDNTNFKVHENGNPLTLAKREVNNNFSTDQTIIGDLRVEGTNTGIEGNKSVGDYFYMAWGSNADDGANIQLSNTNGHFGLLRIYNVDVLEWRQNYIESKVPIRFNGTNPTQLYNGEIWYDGTNMLAVEGGTSGKIAYKDKDNNFSTDQTFQGDINALQVINLASYTNPSPANGDIWNDGAKINIQAGLKVKRGNNSTSPALDVLNDANVSVLRFYSDADGDGQFIALNSAGSTIFNLDTDANGGYHVLLNGVQRLGSTANASSVGGDIWYDQSQTTLKAHDSQGAFNIRGRYETITTTTSIAPNIDQYEQININAQAGALTIAVPSGTPYERQKFIIRIRDDGTAHTLNWNNIYTPIGVTLPTQTRGDVNKVLYVGCIYNANLTRWDVIAVAEEA
jgi:hypothetical protein